MMDAKPDADQLVMHGLLAYLHDRDAASREARIERVLDALPRPAVRRFVTLAKIVTGVAALALISTLVFVAAPGQSTAYALVQASIGATSEAGRLRYDIHLLAQPGDVPADEPTATVDMDGVLVVVRHRPPDWRGLAVVGRDAEGEWAIRRDGTIDREQARLYFPPWAVAGQTQIVDSLDRMLEHLASDYELEKVSAHEVRATRGRRDGPYPHIVDLDIDPATDLPTRVVFRWDEQLPDRPPLTAIIFELVDAPELPEGWFSAAHHAGD